MVTRQRYLDVTRPIGLVEIARLAWATLRSYVTGPLTADEILRDRGAKTTSGAVVTEATALNISAVWNAVQIIAGTLGSLPLVLYRRLGDGARERYIDHPLYRILHDEPNGEMSAMTFRQTLQQHVLLQGNGYAEIQRDTGGRVRALWPLEPWRVTPRRDASRALYYDVTNGDRPNTRLDPKNIMHIKGPSRDGICGLSILTHARESFGLTLAAEGFGSGFFGRNATAGGILTHPRSVQKPTRDALRAQLDEYTAGGSMRPMILEEGMTWVQTTIPPDDAQFLQTRKFQVTEIARWFNIPPHKLKDLERATFSNIEHQALEFVIDTLRPWLVQWEQEVDRKLISPLERRQQFAEHLVDALLRGDIESRYRAHSTARQWGWASVNDVRRMENMNPLPPEVGDMYLVPANMIPADQAGKPAVSPAAPEQVDDPTTDEPPARAVAGVSREEVRAMVEALIEETRPTPPPAQATPPPNPDPEVIIGHRAMVADIAGRMMRQEGFKARRAAKSPERLRAWIGEFYPRHGEKVAVALLPALRAHVAMLGDGGDAEDYARRLVAAEIEDSRAQLHALLDASPADLQSAVDGLVARWEIERPAAIADRILHEEMTHA